MRSEGHSPVLRPGGVADLTIRECLHTDVVSPARHEAIEGSLGRAGGLGLPVHVELGLDRVLGLDGHLVVSVVTGGVGRLPENKQSCLIPKPDNEASRGVGLGGEVGRDVGGALLLLVDAVQLYLVGGAGCQVFQSAFLIAGLDVLDCLARLREGNHLQFETREAAAVWRIPADYGYLAALDVDVELGGRVGGGVDGPRPGEVISHRAVGVKQPECVLGAGQPSGEVDRVLVTNVPGPQGGVGCR